MNRHASTNAFGNEYKKLLKRENLSQWLFQINKLLNPGNYRDFDVKPPNQLNILQPTAMYADLLLSPVAAFTNIAPLKFRNT